MTDDRIGPEVVVLGADDTVNAANIEFCARHAGEIRMALIQRGLGEDCGLSDEERVELLAAGQMDAYTAVQHNITMSAMCIFGAPQVVASGGCPACAFGTVIDVASDDIAMRMTRKN